MVRQLNDQSFEISGLDESLAHGLSIEQIDYRYGRDLLLTQRPKGSSQHR
jgi:hypothetical protein